MNDDRKLVLAQKKAWLKEEQKRAEIQQFKDHFAKNIEHFSQKYRYADEDVEREGFFHHRRGPMSQSGIGSSSNASGSISKSSKRMGYPTEQSIGIFGGVLWDYF